MPASEVSDFDGPVDGQIGDDMYGKASTTDDQPVTTMGTSRSASLAMSPGVGAALI